MTDQNQSTLKPVTFETVPGTDIDEIMAAHPDWTEDQCQEEQSRVAREAFLKISQRRTK